MRAIAGITLILCLAAPLFAQVSAELTTKDMARLRQEIAVCWQVNPDLPPVTLRFSLDRSGEPQDASVRITHPKSGTDAAIEQAFGLAKRAVLRCGRDGFTLPVEKYEKWRDIELTFDPERTILR